MPSSDYFAQLGLFFVKGFLDAQSCSRLRSEMRSSIHTPAPVLAKGVSLEQESARRTKWASVSDASLSSVATRLLDVRPVLANHFNLLLTGYAKPQFLVYNAGDFYRAHQDRDDCPVMPGYIQKRRVSVVIFLNGNARDSEPGSYAGGALTFYGLMDDQRWQRFGLPLVSEEGLLVAFPSKILHEVSAVTRGERYTIVSWFF
jgi:SM-20-related protein